MTTDTCVQLPCACFQLPHANFIANANNISQLDRVRVHQPEFVRKCKRFSNRNMLRTTAACANLHQPRRNGRSPGRSAAALPSKHPKGRADAERQCQTTFSILFLRRDARDPSYRTPSARSSRISKNISNNSVFRPGHAYFSRPRGYPSL